MPACCSRSRASSASLAELAGWRDANGSNVAHYFAMAGLERSWDALAAASGELVWLDNDACETPQALRDGLRGLTAREAGLHRALRAGESALLRTGSAVVAPAVREGRVCEGVCRREGGLREGGVRMMSLLDRVWFRLRQEMTRAVARLS